MEKKLDPEKLKEAFTEMYEALDALLLVVGLTAFRYESQREVLQIAVNAAGDALKKARENERT